MLEYADKIRKLLAVADDPKIPKEAAETYRDHALMLAAKWRIDITELSTIAPNIGVVSRYVIIDGIPKIYARFVAFMASHIVEGLGGIGAAVDGRTCRFLVIAQGDDIDRIDMTTRLIVAQAMSEFNTWARSSEFRTRTKYYTAMEKYVVRRTFFRGFSDRVTLRLDALTKTAVAETMNVAGTALAFIDRAEPVKQHAENNFSIKSSRPRRSS